MLNGVRYPSVTAVPGWTYTGGTPAGTGSYAPKADGSLQFFPSVTNLLLQSQTLDNAGWVKTDTTITANAVAAPDGTTTADLVTEGSAGTALLFSPTATISPSVQNVESIYLKRGNTDWIRLRFFSNDGANGVNAWFNLATGAAGTTTTTGSPTNVALVASDVGGGWFRVSISATLATSTTANLSVASAVSNGATGRVSGATYYAWGAQLELGSTASTYIPTTTAAVTVAPPRITDAGYLAEEARTNVVPRSAMTGATSSTLPPGMAVQLATGLTQTVVGIGEEYGLPYFDWSITGTASGTGYPALLLTPTGTNAPAASNGQTWTGSVYYRVVSGSLPTGMIGVGTQIFNGAAYLSGLSSTSPSTATGFTRLTTTGTIANASTTGVTLYVGSPGGVTTGTVVNVVIRIYAPQLELGSFATSPIPTTSVAVTRAADVMQITNAAPSLGYTLLASVNSPILTGNRNIITLGTQRGQIYANGTTYSNAIDGFANLSSQTQTAGLANLAATFGPSAQSLGINGTLVGNTTNATSDGATRTVYIGNSAAPSQWFNAPICRIVIYPRAMSNSELQAITTAGAY